MKSKCCPWTALSPVALIIPKPTAYRYREVFFIFVVVVVIVVLVFLNLTVLILFSSPSQGHITDCKLQSVVCACVCGCSCGELMIRRPTLPNMSVYSIPLQMSRKKSLRPIWLCPCQPFAEPQAEQRNINPNWPIVFVFSTAVSGMEPHLFARWADAVTTRLRLHSLQIAFEFFNIFP